MSFTVRRLAPGDEPLVALIAEEASDFDLAGQSSPETPLPAADAAAYLADPAVLHWVAEEDGRVIGELLCHVLRMPSRHARELLLYSIGVRAGERRRGVGGALVEEMLRWMREEGVPEVWVLADNAGAEAFYAACGFELGGEGEQGVLMLLNVGAGGDETGASGYSHVIGVWTITLSSALGTCVASRGAPVSSEIGTMFGRPASFSLVMGAVAPVGGSTPAVFSLAGQPASAEVGPVSANAASATVTS